MIEEKELVHISSNQTLSEAKNPRTYEPQKKLVKNGLISAPAVGVKLFLQLKTSVMCVYPNPFLLMDSSVHLLFY